MKTTLYKKVHTQAIEMLKAADSDNDEAFLRLYEELKALCYDNESDEHNNHPVQWETLADFTENDAQAFDIYKKALGYAEKIQAHDYIASICYAMALLLKDGDILMDDEVPGHESRREQALLMARRAEENARRCEDKELQREIKVLLKSLSV